MSLIDSKLEFSYNQKLDGVTSAGVDSENVLDLGKENNHLTGNRYGAGYLNIVFTGDAPTPASNVVTIKLQHSLLPNGPFVDASECVMEKPDVDRELVVNLPEKLNRYLKIKYVPAQTITKATVSAYIGMARADN